MLDSSKLHCLKIVSAYKLINAGNNMQPWCTPFPIRNHSVLLLEALTVASWFAYKDCMSRPRCPGTTL
ncbi:hypothetical protein GDO78_016400 [Eleutherodactylus coqui]|uniref:Uncharacterized protein n=1 Tax=Eleutherodactylus coqui TaxID=57060 RepID=A0A8J6E825_ELECQ|nr:hypothetical protein GDO78_016400 [Eleutherodactylus coqui]